MGGAVSAGKNNEELVDNLVDVEYIKTPAVERVFRAVDRGDYYLPEHRDAAYKDVAWKCGHLHLSAPCIYAEVLEALCLGPGMSFLNLGSGTGYLSTMAGLILGPYGINQGIEYHREAIDYAVAGLERFRQTCELFDEFEFCEPQFSHGNCLLLSPQGRLYDRVYCGAACPPENENYMKQLLAVGGILVMPLNDQLLQITRTSETTWDVRNVLPVSFAPLIMPMSAGPNDIIELAMPKPMSLYEICRVSIRRVLRRNIQLEHPTVTTVVAKRRSQNHEGCRAQKRRRINLVPMQTGLMIVGQFPTTESDDDDEDDIEQDNGNDDDSGHSSVNHNHGFDEDDSRASDDDASDRPEELPSQLVNSDSFLRRLFWPSGGTNEARNAIAEELGFHVRVADREAEALIENEVAHAEEISEESDNDDAVRDHALEECSQATSKAIVINNEGLRSSNGYSTSYSSGICAGSSVGAESEPGNAVDSVSGDDVFRTGSSAPMLDGFFDDKSLEFCRPSTSSSMRMSDRSVSTTFDDHLAERMKGIVEVQDETFDDEMPISAESVAKLEVPVTAKITIKRLMHEKVDMLPIPSALKDYLLYHRKL